MRRKTLAVFGHSEMRRASRSPSVLDSAALILGVAQVTVVADSVSALTSLQ